MVKGLIMMSLASSTIFLTLREFEAETGIFTICLAVTLFMGGISYFYRGIKKVHNHV
jgi:hypothetical protein